MALAHRMVDDALDPLRDPGSGPAWLPVPDAVRSRLQEALPIRGIGADAAYERFLRDVAPYPVGNAHPRFWGWVIGSGLPFGALADFLAAALNPNVTGLASSAPLVEEQVLVWLRALLGHPEDGGGILTSGASMASVIGLHVGMMARGGVDPRRGGVRGAAAKPVLYASDQVHFSVRRAARLLGLGDDALRTVPSHADGTIRLDALRERIREDRAAGHRPFAVVGGAGNTATGAIDPLAELADLADGEDLWLHVDAAVGAALATAPEHRPLLRGIERADSIALDLHKWFLLPIETGAVLINDRGAQEDTYGVQATYVEPLRGGVGRPDVNFTDLGPQQSRAFRALKVWLSFLAYGREGFADVVRRNLDQAAHLASRVDAHPALERTAPTPINIVCFRYVGGSGPEEGARDLDALNREIVVRLQETGVAVPSHATLGAGFSIRVCITNHRTEVADLDALVDEVVRVGRVLEGRGIGP